MGHVGAGEVQEPGVLKLRKFGFFVWELKYSGFEPVSDHTYPGH